MEKQAMSVTELPSSELLIFRCLDKIEALDQRFDLALSVTTSDSQDRPNRQQNTIVGLLSECLKNLFEVSTKDSEFYAYSKMLLALYFRQQGDENYNFEVTLGARSNRIVLSFLDSIVEDIYFEYDKPLVRARLSWHTFFMNQAFQASERSTCASGRRVGAVYVKNKAPLVSSYNGVPSKYPHPVECPRLAAGCKSGEGLDMCPCNHAEMNGMALAARKGVVLEGSTLYCTSKPCAGCMGILANLNLAAIIYSEDYPHPLSSKISKYAKLPVYHIDDAEGEHHEL